MKRLITFFMQGLVLVAPIVITGYIIYLTFEFIDGLLRNVLENYLGHIVPGLGLAIIFVLLAILGYLGEKIAINPIKKIWDRMLNSAPLLKVVYTSLADLFSAFAGKEKKFNKPVIVCINKENNLWKIGFITQKSMEEIGMPGMVAVYFPHSYNFSGELYMIDSASVKLLEMPPAEAMKFVVSGGVTRVN